MSQPVEIVKVAVVTHVPMTAFRYQQGQKLVKSAVRQHFFSLKKDSHIVVNFRDSTPSNRSESFILGLADEMNAHPRYTWSVRFLRGEHLELLREHVPSVQTLESHQVPVGKELYGETHW